LKFGGSIDTSNRSLFKGKTHSYASALEAEFSSCMMAIEKAAALHIANLWIETDSLVVVKAFNHAVGIPWRMQARWQNCLQICTHLTCKCTHIRREGNLVADSLAKNAQNHAMFSSRWWELPPTFVRSLLFRDSLSLPFSRISMD